MIQLERLYEPQPELTANGFFYINKKLITKIVGTWHTILKMWIKCCLFCYIFFQILQVWLWPIWWFWCNSNWRCQHGLVMRVETFTIPVSWKKF